MIETYDTGTTWCPVHNGVCVTHVPTGIIECCSDSRSLHTNLDKVLGEIKKKIEHISHKENTMNDRISSEIFTTNRLARCLAASAIHQIGGTLESKSMLPGSALLRNMTNEMLKCAEDILETVKSDPWMFCVMINTAVSSGVIKLIDMKGDRNED